MGRRIDGFDIHLSFDANGLVVGYTYGDDEGCGHTRQFSTTTELGEVAKYHLRHYKSSHKMEPAKRCTYTLKDTEAGLSFECTLPPHGVTINHELKQA